MELEKAVEIRNVTGLRLQNFRNYEALAVELGPGFNVLEGANAQGKTNLLEALNLVATTRLLRGFRDAEAIREGAERAEVQVDLGPSTTIGMTLERGLRKRALLNGLGLPRASDVIGRLPAVCVSSADLPIVAGEPSDRRLFLDLELSQIHVGYLKSFGVYKRAVEQRNSLLRSAQETGVDPASFEAWEVQMAEHGAAMRTYRHRFVESVGGHSRAIHARLGDGEELGIRYAQKDEANDAETLFRLFGQTRGNDIGRGSTSVGPHRDDVEVLIEGREARLFGSQGQQRSATIALKLATHEHMRDVLGEAPMLLLDDMLSDLDADRRARLCEWVSEHAGQAVLTCTEIAAAGPDIVQRATIFHVRAGTIERR